MRVSVHRELMKDCINNGDFAKNTGAGSYDTLSKKLQVPVTMTFKQLHHVFT